MMTHEFVRNIHQSHFNIAIQTFEPKLFCLTFALRIRIFFPVKLEEFEQLWSKEFRNYFNKYIKNSIISNCGRWILEYLNIYNVELYSGIATNVAESINNVIKSIQKRKELPLDQFILFTKKSDYTELLCGRVGLTKSVISLLLFLKVVQ